MCLINSQLSLNQQVFYDDHPKSAAKYEFWPNYKIYFIRTIIMKITLPIDLVPAAMRMNITRQEIPRHKDN